MKSKKLLSGDKVAIVSLSSGILGESFIKHELDLGVKRLQEFKLVPEFMTNSLLGIEKLKNNPNLRADDLKQAVSDKSIKAIISAIGGNDAYKLLPYIFEDKNFCESVKKNPKIFMGYSDTTTIHLALNKLGLNTFYGPALITDFAEFENDMLPYTKKAIFYLFDAPETYEIKPSEFWYKERTDFSPNAVGTPRERFAETRGYELVCGSKNATGKLWGGCIDIISSLANAQFYPDKYNETQNVYANDVVEILKKYPILPVPGEMKNKILFLETSDEKVEPKKYREMILTLKNIGYFKNVQGVIVGKPMDEKYYEEYKQVLKEELSEYNIPVLANLKFGHSFPRAIIPYGATAVINAKSKTISLVDTTLI